MILKYLLSWSSRDRRSDVAVELVPVEGDHL